jgi:predicted dehydrogenase
MRAPTFDRAEALAVEAKHFVECVQTGKTPLTDGRAGLRVVRILEAAAGSIAAHGQMVEL